TSARELVEVVPHRIALVVILVVILGRVELRGRDDLRDDRAWQLAALLELPLRALCELALLLVVIEDRAAVLLAAIAELPAGIDRIDVAPKHAEQRLVAHDVRIVLDLDGLGVPGIAARHLLVLRIRDVSADVAGSRRNDAVDLVERFLHAPEASAGERCDGRILRALLRSEERRVGK